MRDGRAESGGDTVLNWLHPLHGGEAFGLTGRLLALVAGILPTILFTTGFMRWSRRRNNSVRRTLAKFAGPNERPRGT